MDNRKQNVAFQIDALDLLVRHLLFEWQRRDPQFCETVRKALDTDLGARSAENPYANVKNVAKVRTAIMEILDDVEKGTPWLSEELASAKPMTILRRILNWFERG